jgi:pyruvate dehydrogenase E1 component beta subunit
MAMSGSGWNAGAQQNWKLEAWLASSPAMKVLMPSTADDFKGLLKAAIRDDGPVLLLADLALLHSAGPIPDGDYVVPLGKARIRRPGTEVTIVACAKMVRTALTAAEVLARRGVSTEVVDLRSLRPLDEQAILTSVRKTGRLIVLHDANPTGRVGAEVAAVVVERAWSSLRAPIAHITCPDAHPGLEAGSTPQADAIVAAANRMTVEEAALV